MNVWRRLAGLFRKEPPPATDHPGPVVEEYDFATAAVLASLREDDQKALPEPEIAADTSEVRWYTRESSEKQCKQIVLLESSVCLCRSPIGGPFIYGPLQRCRAWGMATVYSDDVPYLCIKCVGVQEEIKTVPSRLAFSFYRYAEGGLFQPILEIPHDANKPFLVENPWNLGGTEILRVGKDLLSRPHYVLQFFDSDMLGVHARVIRPPDDCMAAINALLQEACQYNESLSDANFKAAENRYYNMNPVDTSPILAE